MEPNGQEPNQLGRDFWNGITMPLLFTSGEAQVDVARVVFSGVDFVALQRYVKNFGLRDTYDAMRNEGWAKDHAIEVLRIVTTKMPESPLA